MTQGNIIILNGTSSSGKTSIVNALQEVLEAPYLEAGIDKFLWMLPGRYLNVPLWRELFAYIWRENGEAMELAMIKAGPLGDQLMSGMHQAIAALARAGNNVVADHVLLEARWLQECAALFAETWTLFVGVRCPLEVLEERERARTDRTLGQARAQYEVVHAHGLYDLEVDTSRFSPLECALQIKRRLQDGPPPKAFQALKNRS